NSAGGSVPSNLASCGLLSKSSRWLGAPAMKRKITRLALGAKCVGCVAKPDSESRCPSAAVPSPTPHCSKNHRRVICLGSMIWLLLLGDRLVQVQHDARHHSPCRHA